MNKHYIKTYLYISLIFSLIFICSTCTNDNCSAQDDAKNMVIDVGYNNIQNFDFDSIFLQLENYKSNVNLKDFKRFQSFDEFNMKGVGEPKYEPFVYHKKSNDTIFVVNSNDTSNVLLYSKRGNYWCNTTFYNGNTQITKSGNELLKRIFYRICGSDTLIEYRCSKWEKLLIKDLYLKTKSKCFWIRLIGKTDLCNHATIYDDMLKLVERYNKEQDAFFSEIGENRYDKRRLNSYQLRIDKDAYIYQGINNKDVLFFQKTSLGLFGIQPGLDNFDIDISACD